MSLNKFGGHIAQSLSHSPYRGVKGEGFRLTKDGNFDLQKKLLTNLSFPLNQNDATTKHYVDQSIKLNEIIIVKSLKNYFEEKIISDISLKSELVVAIANSKTEMSDELGRLNRLAIRTIKSDVYEGIENFVNSRISNDLILKTELDEKLLKVIQEIENKIDEKYMSFEDYIKQLFASLHASIAQANNFLAERIEEIENKVLNNETHS